MFDTKIIDLASIPTELAPSNN